jgi:PhnB protein
MVKLNTYLSFNGQCEAAFKFYAQVLGGQVVFSMTWGESPMAEQMPPETHKSIMHTTLRIGEGALMGADAPPEYFRNPQGFSVSVSISDKAEAERIFNDLAAGGEVKMPYQKTFWAAGFGMCIDKFGIPWMVNCEEGNHD